MIYKEKSAIQEELKKAGSRYGINVYTQGEAVQALRERGRDNEEFCYISLFQAREKIEMIARGRVSFQAKLSFLSPTEKENEIEEKASEVTRELLEALYNKEEDVDIAIEELEMSVFHESIPGKALVESLFSGYTS